MQPFDRIRKYTQDVSDQIRWKRGKKIISEEIENHLIDQRDAYMAEGTPEEAATDMAIEQMGDPVDIGTQLDRVHRPKPEWSMIFLTGLTLLLGISIQLFIVKADDLPGQSIRSMASALIGVSCLTGAYFTDFNIIGKHSKLFYWGFIIFASFCTILTKLGSTFSLMLSAPFLPLLFPLSYSALIYTMKDKKYRGLILCDIGVLLPSFLAVLTPSATDLLIYLVSGIVLLLTAIHNNWFDIKKVHGYILMIISSLAVASFLALCAHIQGDYIWNQLMIKLFPWIDPTRNGYITRAIRDLIQGAVFIGQGTLGENTRNPVLPLIDTDYVLTYLIHRFGWIAFAVIVLILGIFIIRGFQLCLHQKTKLGLFVSASIMLTVTLQTAVYILSNLGLQEIAPLSLPLISYGNTVTIVNMALIGIMLSVFRMDAIARDTYREKRVQRHFISRSSVS